MKYRIVEYTPGRFYPECGGWVFWNPLLDLMNKPASFADVTKAVVFIKRYHINRLNSTEPRRVKWSEKRKARWIRKHRDARVAIAPNVRGR